MAFLVKDRVLETANSPGTGVVNLLGAVTGYQSFVTALVTSGTTTYYCIADQSGNNWEVGLGTFTTTSGNQLTRNTVYSSSNAGGTVNFNAGLQNVFITYPSEEAVFVDPSGNTYAPNIGGTTASTGKFTNFTASGTASFTSTGAVLLPAGSTAQEPVSPTEGMIRYNTDTKQFEGYSEVASTPGWYSVGGSSISNDTASSTAYYPLFAHATSGTAQVIYTANTEYLFKPSTGELTAAEVIAGNGIFVNNQTISTSYTIPTGYSASSTGPVTIASGKSVTVPSGSRWVVL